MEKSLIMGRFEVIKIIAELLGGYDVGNVAEEINDVLRKAKNGRSVSWKLFRVVKYEKDGEEWLRMEPRFQFNFKVSDLEDLVQVLRDAENMGKYNAVNKRKE